MAWSSDGLSRRKFLRHGLEGTLAASLFSGFPLGGCGWLRSLRKPNILLVTIDTLRFDHLGCYGYPRETSPFIDSFAREALLFENCFAHAPNTWSSIASLMTGFLPHETKVMLRVPIAPEVPTLPTTLRDHGYATAAVVSNFALKKGNGYERGFEIYDDRLGEKESGREMPERTAVHTSDRAIELIERFEKERFFLWVHYQDPHGPYTPPTRFSDRFSRSLEIDRENGRRRLPLNSTNSGIGGIPRYQRLGGHRDYAYYVAEYDAEIRYVDEQLERLFGAMKKRGLYEDALILLTADHGEGMGERDYFFSHGDNLYGHQIRVPCILRDGGRTKGRSARVVQHVDFVPTVLRAAGIKPDERLRGRNLQALDEKPREIFGAMFSKLSPVDDYDSYLLHDGMKLLHTPFSDRKYQLFDLRTDSSEERDLVEESSHRAVFEAMRSRLNNLKAEDRLGLEGSLFEALRDLTPEETKALKALGYID